MLQIEAPGTAIRGVAEAAAARPGWRRRAPVVAAWVAILACAAVVALHAALLPAGRWQGDEYGTLAAYHAQGLSFLRYRLLHWSPRPVSEPLVEAYAALVFRARAPLVVPALAVPWAALVGLAGASLWGGGGGKIWRGVILAGVLAAFLLGHPIGEMFYWPMAALAYLPALAGLTVATFALIRGLDAPRAGGRRAAFAAGLLLASLSAEVGAMATLCLCGLLGAGELAARRRPWPWLARSAWWGVPLLAAAGVMALLLDSRAGAAGEVGGPTAHHLWPSLAAAARQFGALLVAPDTPPGATLPPWWGLAWWLPLLGAGFSGAWRLSGAVLAPARHLLALAAGLLAAAYGSLASAAFQFGAPCCQRHDSFRACLVVLALVALAALAARAGGAVWRRVPAGVWPVLLLLGLLPPALARAHPWHMEWRQLGAQVALRRANWAAGEAPGPAMTLHQPLPPRVVNDGTLPVNGHYDRASGAVPWFVLGVLDFYRKAAIDIIPYAPPPTPR